MKTIKIIIFLALGCVTLCFIFWTISWFRMHSALDVNPAVYNVAHRLHVSPDKLEIINAPKRNCPVVIFTCLEDRIKILENCEPLIPSTKSLNRLTEDTWKTVLRATIKESERVKKKIYREFKVYEIALNQPIENLFYVKGCTAGTLVVAETQECLYVLCYINNM